MGRLVQAYEISTAIARIPRSRQELPVNFPAWGACRCVSGGEPFASDHPPRV